MTTGEQDRERRMRWWHEARFGMFIHWGRFSVIGRHGCAVSDDQVYILR